MNAIVVYESHWGNTAQIAKAIAEGLGPEATALPTSSATPSVVASADLIVAGAPVNAFGLPTEQIRESIANQHASPPPDLSHPSLRAWLKALPLSAQATASFETRVRWSPGGATGAIDRIFRELGYQQLSAPEKFIVTGTHGPLRDGEVERARAWGSALADAVSKKAPR